MAQIDLDDLPPKVALILSSLAEGETLAIVKGGALLARLKVAEGTPAPPATEPATGEGMAEVMDHFRSVIEDEF